MAGWILVACLVTLRSEFDAIAPGRDRASDGSKGDTAHESSQSDHNPDETGNVPIRDADKKNEVHAIDVDADLRTPGLSMENVVQFLLSRCRSGAEKRLRYIIYNRRIWSASNGWRQQSYTGANPHDKHAHFSASYDSNDEASTASWHLEDIPVALTADDKKWISDAFKLMTDTFTTIARIVVKEELEDYGRADGDTTGRIYSRDGLATTTEQDTKKLREEVREIGAKLDEILSRMNP